MHSLNVSASTRQRDAVFKAVESISAEMVSFLQELTRIPTINPPGDAYPAGAECIGNKLREFGYEIQYVAAEGLAENTQKHPRVNVIGSMQGRNANPLLHFNGHFDVVPVGMGWTRDPFAGEISGGKLYGRGTADQKAGIAASIFAVEAIRRTGIKLAGTIEQSGTVDEESGGFAGVAYLAQKGFIKEPKTDYVIITEPSNVERVCIGHRGVYWFKVTTHGRIAHGSMPHFGINAIDHLGDVIHAVTHELKPKLGTRSTSMPVEPPGSRVASININSVFGGQPEDGMQTPCVADRAGAIFDRRFLKEENFEDVKAEVKSLLEALRSGNELFRYELQDVMIVHPTETDRNSRLVSTLTGNIGTVLRDSGLIMASPGTYDQKHVVRLGHVKNCVAYGPGKLDLAHLPDEYVTIEDLVNAAKVMALTTIDLLGTL